MLQPTWWKLVEVSGEHNVYAAVRNVFPFQIHQAFVQLVHVSVREETYFVYDEHLNCFPRLPHLS